MGDPSSRYVSIDYREALISLFPRLYRQVMGDLPTRFSLESGQIQRVDIPRKVIREAVANALMHRDYRAGQPTQIIRYSNRLEFRNAGYSLKPFSRIGQPGSELRNPIIAGVFHELQFAETKGTGIRVMQELLRNAGITTPPIIETSREHNEFDLALLPHHLLGEKDLQWLSQFKDLNLSNAEQRALAFVREMQAITNQDYRQINGVDTLTASRGLRRLRGLKLLQMKGESVATFYILNKESYSQDTSPPKSFVSEAPHISASSKFAHALPPGFPQLPEILVTALSSLTKRSGRQEIKNLVKELCKLESLQVTQLAKLFGRSPRYLREKYLTEMLKTGELVYKYPDHPAHPQQGYRTPDTSKESQ